MDPVLQALMTTGGNAIMGAVVVWVVHTLLSKTLPAVQDRFDAALKVQLAFLGDLVKGEREDCNKRHEQLMETFQARQAELREDFSALVTATHRLTDVVVGEAKEGRHRLADLIHILGLREYAKRVRENEAGAGADADRPGEDRPHEGLKGK